MRITVAVVLAIVMLFAGFMMLGAQSQASQPDHNNSTNTTSEAYNMTTSVYTGFGNVLANALPYLGFIAILAAAIGLTYLGGSGR